MLGRLQWAFLSIAPYGAGPRQVFGAISRVAEDVDIVGRMAAFTVYLPTRPVRQMTRRRCRSYVERPDVNVDGCFAT